MFKHSLLILSLLCSSLSAQVPEHLGETYVQAAMVLMRPNASRAAVYFDKGFGHYPITLTSATNWQLTIGESPYLYALIRIREGLELTDDYWVTEKSTWTAYLTHKNVTTLKNASWQFAHFTLTSDYIVPDFVMPVVWEERTPELSVGYSADNTLIAVEKQDGSWEWVVRGLKDSGTWQTTPTKAEAQAAASVHHQQP